MQEELLNQYKEQLNLLQLLQKKLVMDKEVIQILNGHVHRIHDQLMELYGIMEMWLDGKGRSSKSQNIPS